MTARKNSADKCVGPQPDDQEKPSSGFDEMGPAMAPTPIHDAKVATATSIPVAATLPDGTAGNAVSMTVSQPRVLRKGLGMKRKLESVASGDAAEVCTKRIFVAKDVISRPSSAPLPGLLVPTPSTKISAETLKTMEENGVQVAVPASSTAKTPPAPPKHAVEPPTPQAEYQFTVKPLMGDSFDLTLSSDSSIFDLKDAIFNKTGMLHEMQLLGHSTVPINFEEEEKFLDETIIPKHCTLSLSVKAATGKPLAQPLFEDGEGYYIEDLFIPRIEMATSSSSHSGIEEEEEDEEGEGENEGETDEEGRARWKTIPLSAIPPSVAESYLGRALAVEDALQDLEALRIEMVVEEVRDTPISRVERIGPATASPVSTSPPPPPPPAAGPPRCFQCGLRCRLGQQFKCKCGNMFCSSHRFNDQHACPFDHQRHDRAKLDHANPKVNKTQVDQL